MPKRTTVTPAAQTAAVLESHDPASLLADRNVRLDARLDKGFIDSVGEFGVLQPLVGYRTGDGQVRVKMGHRRRLAAIETGVTPVLVVVYPTEADTPAAEIERILSQLAENEDRAGLLTTEKARAIQDALDLGLPVGDLARRRRMRTEDIRAAQAVVRSEAAGKAADSNPFLTLDQAGALAEFEDDPEATQFLIQAAERGTFEHSLQRLRDQRDEAARDAQLVTEARAGLEADGVTVLDERLTWSWQLAHLRDADGQVLTPETHSECPGHAAYIGLGWHWTDPEPVADEDQEPVAGTGTEDKRGAEGRDQDPDGDIVGHEDDYDEEDEAEAWEARNVRVAQLTWFCTDPEGNGHQPSIGGRAAPAAAADPEAASEERRKVIANNKAWRSAEKVRRRWLANELLNRKSPPAGAMPFLIGELARGDYCLRRALEGGHGFAQPLLGLPEPKSSYGPAATAAILDTLANASTARTQVIGLALVLGACEAATGVHTWRDPIDAASRRYFAALKGWGYPLSDVEQIVLAEADPS